MYCWLTLGASASTLLAIYGGRIDELESILVEERIPEGWEPRWRARKGLTIAQFNSYVFRVESGVDEKPFEKE
jgi:hypothetical protein